MIPTCADCEQPQTSKWRLEIAISQFVPKYGKAKYYCTDHLHEKLHAIFRPSDRGVRVVIKVTEL